MGHARQWEERSNDLAFADNTAISSQHHNHRKTSATTSAAQSNAINHTASVTRPVDFIQRLASQVFPPPSLEVDRADMSSRTNS